MNGREVKRGILLFWAAWLTLVLAGNLAEGLQASGLLAREWRLASGNYGLILETIAVYRVPAWAGGLLFAGVITWQAAAALSFWRACWCFRGRAHDPRATYRAFAISAGLFAAFLIADEVFKAYRMAEVHMGIFTALLASLLTVALLPE